MKKSIFCLILATCFLSGCTGSTEQNAAEPAGSAESKVASVSEMARPEQVVTDDMQPISGSEVKDGVYQITVDSSSSMFNITDCTLTVENGKMTAAMTMSGIGYLYVYMGTGEQAVQASEDDYIPYIENEDGTHTFTVPVESLDAGIDCCAFSKNKEKWYDRTLVFRADSLPVGALSDGTVTTLESLHLQDGTYSVNVTLEGGSGRASIKSPATLTIQNGTAAAQIVWESSNYDYMKVNDVQYDPVSVEENAVFEIPVIGFDYKMPVLADTTAMSTPHEIEYTLYFDSSSIQQK